MNAFTKTLKNWRAIRRFSQLDLATEAEISGRHLSFLETGRARPSRDMVLRLSETLQLPLDARNQMLNDAGFAAIYSQRKWSDIDMIPLRQAVDRMLQTHLPFPGLVLDRNWCIIDANLPATNLFGQFGVGVGDSLVDLLLSDTLPELVENWPDVAKSAAARLRTESVAQGGNAGFDRVASYLSDVAGSAQTVSCPVIPTILKLPHVRLSMFATIAQIGTPEDVALDDLKIELYFPMDQETQHAFEVMNSA